MAAVAAILATIQDKPLSHWRFPIQPNSMVSVFSTLSNSTLLFAVAKGLSQLKWIYFQKKRHRLFDLQVFDDASRGPLGSLRLLWMLKLQSTLASVGAIVAIVSLAMDPFTQQVLSYHVVTVNATHSSVSLPAAKAYNYNIPPIPGTSDPVLNYNVLAGMTPAAFMAMFSTSNKVSFNCPVGNCMWPEFTTAAICNNCTNQTRQLRPNCPSDADNGTHRCMYTFSNELSVGAYSSTSQGNWTLMNITVNHHHHHHHEKFGPSIGNISYIGFPRFDGDLQNSTRPLAYSCEMTWCQQTFSSSKTLEGVLEDNPTKLSPLTFLPCKPLAGAPGEGELMCPGFPSDQSPPHWPHYNHSILNDSSAIWIGNESARDVFNWLNGTLTLSVSTEELESNSNWEVLTNVVVAKMLYNKGFDNVTSTFDKIATALTNAVRQGPNTTSITGQAQALDVYIRVRWAWLSLPLMLVVFGVSFLAISIMFSSRPGRHVWKSSTLATIFHRLDGWTPDELDQRTEKDMKAAARKMQVVIDTDANGDISVKLVR
ncbi:Protein of unknown function (DUF3176) domain containing protein [Elaphomyces granulatus]